MSAITGPLDFISLQSMKDELVFALDIDDALITEKIKAGISMIEEETRWRFYPRDEVIDYDQVRTPLELFQHPINTTAVVNQDNEVVVFTVEKYPLRRLLKFGYCTATGLVVTLNTGATDTDQIPSGLRDAVKRQIVFLYEERNNSKAAIPDDVTQMIGPYKRFTYF